MPDGSMETMIISVPCTLPPIDHGDPPPEELVGQPVEQPTANPDPQDDGSPDVDESASFVGNGGVTDHGSSGGHPDDP